MIDTTINSIVFDAKIHPIDRYEVWWSIPGRGLVRTLAQALIYGGPIYPSPVAISVDGMYELLPPELVDSRVEGTG